MSQLLTFLNSIHPLSAPCNDFLLKNIRERSYKRKEYLLRAGQVSTNIFFIEQGLVRCFYEKYGVEICEWFMKEHDVVVSVKSFFFQQKSLQNIQALEDTLVHYISFKELQFICRTYVEFNIVRSLLLEKYYALSEDRNYSLKMHTAIERYNILLKNNPELVQRVPSKYIASYLGIAEETLSRTKAKMVRKSS